MQLPVVQPPPLFASQALPHTNVHPGPGQKTPAKRAMLRILHSGRPGGRTLHPVKGRCFRNRLACQLCRTFHSTHGPRGLPSVSPGNGLFPQDSSPASDQERTATPRNGTPASHARPIHPPALWTCATNAAGTTHNVSSRTSQPHLAPPAIKPGIAENLTPTNHQPFLELMEPQAASDSVIEGFHGLLPPFQGVHAG